MSKLITLRPVEKEESDYFWDLLQEYLAEDGGRVFAAPKNIDGSYAYPYFDLYWQEPARFPFYIMSENDVAGLVMIRRLADDLYSIAEFYIRHHFRRAGIGRDAMNEVFKAFSEKSWLISVIRQNKPAYEFWLNIAEHFPIPIELEIIEKRRYHWPDIQ